jgi:hypothetical protein
MAHYFLYPQCLHAGRGRSGTETGSIVGVYVKILGRDYKVALPGVTGEDGGGTSTTSALRIEYCVYDLRQKSRASRASQCRLARRRVPWVETPEEEIRGDYPGDILTREALHVPMNPTDIEEIMTRLQRRYAYFNTPNSTTAGASTNSGNVLLLV